MVPKSRPVTLKVFGERGPKPAYLTDPTATTQGLHEINAVGILSSKEVEEWEHKTKWVRHHAGFTGTEVEIQRK